MSLEDESEIQSFGLYEPKYDFESSDHYKFELDLIRKQQKQMIKDKSAAVCYTQWTVDGSKRKGQTQINEQLKLMLRAFIGKTSDCEISCEYFKINEPDLVYEFQEKKQEKKQEEAEHIGSKGVTGRAV